jgi:hypothetical protein
MATVHIWADDPKGKEPRSPHYLVSHGTLLTFGENPTDIDVVIKEDYVRIRFEFPSDSSGTRLEYAVDPGIQGDKKTPPTVRLRFHNVTALTVFADGPVRIGTVGGIALWLCYEVAAVPGTRLMKRINYTVWDGSAPDEAHQLIPGPAANG